MYKKDLREKGEEVISICKKNKISFFFGIFIGK
jgi:hypothetical protein